MTLVSKATARTNCKVALVDMRVGVPQGEYVCRGVPILPVQPGVRRRQEDRDDDVDEHETATEEFTQLLSSPPEEAVDQVNVNPAAAALHSVAAGPVK